MEHATSSSSSKVTVEYTDPSNLYQTIAQDLSHRLPLRNLHWNSSTRPLRSIKSLHVDLAPDDKRSSQPAPVGGGFNQSQNGAAGQNLAGEPKTGDRPTPVTTDSMARKERRHQIPGLRKTPYLKIYLLRCDNVDTYKASSRKLLREWVKDHTPPSQKSSKYNTQENHDAFEWLILHVVSPNDATNSNRGSGDSKDSRWSKRSSSNLIEKIRTDFNGTSKSAVDRVAQVYLLGETTGQSSEDGDTGWGDLIFKLKSLILASFDLRVRQYEEDIKEKESQRSLPGWNFNTFFVLKEGLARGFESVGLVEDALTSYHELAAGLESILEGQHAEESMASDTARFSEYTDDLLTVVNTAAEREQTASKLSNGESQHDLDKKDFGNDILDTDRKPFREFILANKISAFDFQCYVFARQASLLLRLANAAPPSPDFPEDKLEPKVTGNNSFSVASSREPENLFIIADVCQRAVDFITSACRTMRNELRAILKQDIDSKIAEAMTFPASPETVVENVIASWTYSATECILSRTSTQSLATQLQPLIRQLDPRKDNQRAVKEMIPSQALPRRTSSLSPATSVLQRPPSPEKYPSVTSLDALRLLPPTSLQTGAQDLASDRAALHSLQRRALGNLGLSYGGWRSGWPDMHLGPTQKEDPMEEVSLDEELSKNVSSNGAAQEKRPQPSMMGVRNEVLRQALSSEQLFYAAYEAMTALALGLYVLGERKKCAEALTADLAAVRFHFKDYAAAASYFRQLAPFYAQGHWSELELVMLDLYAQCLERLERKEEYVSIALKIVAKQVEATRNSYDGGHNGLQEHLPSSSKNYLQNLIQVSESLGKPMMAPMERYFDSVSLEPQIRHSEDEDSIYLLLNVKQRMLESVRVQEVRVCLVRMAEEQRTELWFSAVDVMIAARSVVTIFVVSKTMNPGLYTLNKVSLRAANIIFQQDLSREAPSIFSVASNEAPSLESESPEAAIPVNVFPSPDALSAQVIHCRKIHLEQPRSLEIIVSSGWNIISNGKLQVRAGTAGLRLHTGDVTSISQNVNIISKSQPGVIEFDRMDAGNDLRLTIPYSVETDLKDIIIRLEVAYTTTNGHFTFACSPKISVLLSLGVNVQDVFMQDALFSKFSIFTTSSVPLRLMHCRLEGTDNFKVHSPPLAEVELDIFARQPSNLMAKIRREQAQHQKSAKSSRRLLLHVQYQCLDEEVSTVLERAFTASVADSDFRPLTRLLTPHLISTLRSRLSGQDYEAIALLREIRIGPSSDYNWPPLLTAMAPENRDAALDWLSSWHTTHLTIPFATSTSSPSPTTQLQTHYLAVPVEIPSLQILHTARLTPLTDARHLALSQALAAELMISHTRRWGTDSAPNKALDFVCEVTAPPDTWLIGGQRKAHFSAHEDEEIKFTLLLLPQRTGHLLYPSVEIRPIAPKQPGEDGTEERRDVVLPSCETDYASLAETVLVVTDLGRTTVSLDPVGNGGSVAWVLETEGRGEGRGSGST